MTEKIPATRPPILATQSAWRGVSDGPTSFSRNLLGGTKEWAAGRMAVALRTLFGTPAGDGFGVLMYHRVAESTIGVAAPTWNVTPRQLRAQLEGLLSRGFQAWSLPKVLEARRASRSVPSNTFVVTFDDGYENNLLNALPILEELRIPATIFLATAFLDSDCPFPFDDWSAAGSTRVPASSWRPLSTDQCRRLLASGWIDLGAHTHTHQRFVGRRDEFQRDLKMSLELLSDRFGVSRPTFAFPFGLTSPELIEAAGEVGAACALSTRPELVSPDMDCFHWGRFTVEGSDSASVLAAKLAGWYTLVDRRFKRPMAAVARSILCRGRNGGGSECVVTAAGNLPASNETKNIRHARQTADHQATAASKQEFSAP